MAWRASTTCLEMRPSASFASALLRVRGRGGWRPGGRTQVAPTDWMAALAAHPRIGEKGGHAPESSEREQGGVHSAAAETVAALADGNRRYEERFSHVFLISAAGRTADEILAALRERLRNDPATEVAVAASELRKIARLRLERMLTE